MKKVSSKLCLEIQNAIESVKGYGSVEIFVQDSKISQITTRIIKKTGHDLPNPCPVLDPSKNCPLLKK